VVNAVIVKIWDDDTPNEDLGGEIMRVWDQKIGREGKKINNFKKNIFRIF